MGKRAEACKQVGCTEVMYCFAGRDKTTNPRMCNEVKKILASNHNKVIDG